MYRVNKDLFKCILVHLSCKNTLTISETCKWMYEKTKSRLKRIRKWSRRYDTYVCSKRAFAKDDLWLIKFMYKKLKDTGNGFFEIGGFKSPVFEIKSRAVLEFCGRKGLDVKQYVLAQRRVEVLEGLSEFDSDKHFLLSLVYDLVPPHMQLVSLNKDYTVYCMENLSWQCLSKCNSFFNMHGEKGRRYHYDYVRYMGRKEFETRMAKILELNYCYPNFLSYYFYMSITCNSYKYFQYFGNILGVTQQRNFQLVRPAFIFETKRCIDCLHDTSIINELRKRDYHIPVRALRSKTITNIRIAIYRWAKEGKIRLIHFVAMLLVLYAIVAFFFYVTATKKNDSII